MNMVVSEHGGFLFRNIELSNYIWLWGITKGFSENASLLLVTLLVRLIGMILYTFVAV